METGNTPKKKLTLKQRQKGLADALEAAFPAKKADHGRDRYGVYSFIANQLGLSRQSVSGWVKRGRIPGSRAQQIVELDGCRAGIDSFTPYF